MYKVGLFTSLAGIVLICSVVTVQCRQSTVNTGTLLECHVRAYTYIVSQPYKTLPCWDNVTVRSCWGRCYSAEVADYRMPYKKSHHPVCTYRRRTSRRVRLRHCHPRHPRKTAIVFDAVTCDCRKCKPDITSCENLTG